MFELKAVSGKIILLLADGAVLINRTVIVEIVKPMIGFVGADFRYVRIFSAEL